MATTNKASKMAWQWVSRGVYRAPWESARVAASWEIRQAAGGSAYFLARIAKAGGFGVMPLDSPENRQWAMDARKQERCKGGSTTGVGRPRGAKAVFQLFVRLSPEGRERVDRLALKLGKTLGETVEMALEELEGKVVK